MLRSISKKIYLSRHIVFDEKKFPGLPTTAHISPTLSHPFSLTLPAVHVAPAFTPPNLPFSPNSITQSQVPSTNLPDSVLEN
jgi:hypothetical protein